MTNTVTITSKDVSIDFQKVANLASLFNSSTDTKTIYPISFTVVYEVNDIDSEMREIENAAILDFRKFEALD